MTELRLALGDNGKIEWEGVVYHTGATSLEVMAQWEDWLAGETLERQIRLLRKTQNGENKAIKAVAEMSAEGVFDFYGETSEKRINTPSGLKQLFFLRILQNNDKVTKKTVNAMIDAKLANELRLQWEKEQAALDAILPNAEAPAGAISESTGLPSSPAS